MGHPIQRSNDTVLIIEDERDVIDLLTLHLRKTGRFLVSTSLDGVEGLRKAQKEKSQALTARHDK